MPTHEADAIVLRQYALSDADRIVVFVTREFGKVRAVGQGVKKLKSRLASCLEPLNHVRLHFWTRQGAELCRIRGCENIHSYLGRNASLEQFYAYNYFAEIVDEFVQENNPNIPLFRLLLAVLRTGETAGIRESLIRYFELWALQLNGLLPNYDYCTACRKYVKDSGFYASAHTGQAMCSHCAAKGEVRVRPSGAEVIRSIMKLSPEQFVSRPFADEAAADTERLTRTLLYLHLEKYLKSYEPLRQIIRGS